MMIYPIKTRNFMKKITLGRLPNNDIVFTPMSVSRMHADLICNNGSYQLIDHSAAGTTVNGYPVHNSSMTVNKGDNILLAGQVPLDWSRVEQIEYGGAGGTQVVQGPYVPPQPQSNGMAIAGFVLSFLIPLLGLIFSIIGLNRSKQMGGKNRGLAIAGIIISSILMVINLICIIIISAADALYW
jgi:hypothetical protein